MWGENIRAKLWADILFLSCFLAVWYSRSNSNLSRLRLGAGRIKKRSCSASIWRCLSGMLVLLPLSSNCIRSINRKTSQETSVAHTFQETIHYFINCPFPTCHHTPLHSSFPQHKSEIPKVSCLYIPIMTWAEKAGLSLILTQQLYHWTRQTPNYWC